MAPSLTQDSKPPKKANLLEDSGSDDEDGGATLAAPQLKVNEEYARKFEHNKKREERQRLEEKYKHSKSMNNGDDDDDESDSESSSDDETEDEDGFLATEDLDAQISGVLSAIKNKDPRVKDKSFSFFQAQSDAATPAGLKKDKPLFLKDYHREKILAGDVGASDDEEDDAPPRTYAQEQAALKNAIVSEINNAAAAGNDSEDAGSDGEFVRKKNKKKPEATGADGIHPSRAATVNALTDNDVANAERNPELYLSNFLSSRAWLEDGKGRDWEAFESDDNDGDDNDRAEEFEHAYNMRFEDPSKSNEVLQSYARDITNAKSVRRDELTGRKRQRQLEKERKEAEKAERREEKARLRRLKVEEAEDRLRKIRKVAGMSGKSLTDEQWLKFLDEDWEGDQWEKEMTKKFGDSYYAEAEAAGSDEDGDEAAEGSKKKHPKKPTWDDDIDINDIIPDFKADEEPDFTLSDDDEAAGEAGAEEEQDQDDEADSDAPPSKKRRTNKDHKKARQTAKAATRADRAKIEALVDSRLDVADDVLAPRSGRERRKAAAEEEAGVHFHYRETSPQAFGMTARDILLAPSDADLNKFAGLKKLATFRDAEKKRKDKKRLGKKARLREWRRETFGRRFERTGPVWEGFEDSKPAAVTAPAPAPSTETKEAQGGDDVQKKKKRKRSRGKKSGEAVDAE